MDYEIVVTVNVAGEEIYKRVIALPEQLPMLRQDVEAAIWVHEDKLREAADDQKEMEENYKEREEGE